MPNRKLEIVARLINEIPEQHRESVDQAMVTWWANIRPEGGLRLTRHGYEILHNLLEMESWEFSIENPRNTLTKGVILDLDHKLQWPYFIDTKKKRIVFFSSREALMATMYGDLRQWLENVVDQK
jgi:hypothetical protein